MEGNEMINDVLSEETKKTKKPMKKFWLITGIIFLLGVGVYAYIAINDSFKNTLTPANMIIENETTFGEFVCSNIRGVPTWVSPNIGIVGEGYASFQNPKEAIDLLINARVFFFYDKDCAPCEDQIGYFGSEWGRYVETGLTVNCNNL